MERKSLRLEAELSALQMARSGVKEYEWRLPPRGLVGHCRPG
jgi:hypothetical protein